MIYLSFIFFSHKPHKYSASSPVNTRFLILFFLASLFVSCSSTKRFPKDEPREITVAASDIDFSSVRVLLDESKAASYLTIQSPVYLYKDDKRLAFIEPGNTMECIKDLNELKIIIRDKQYSGDTFFLQPAGSNHSLKVNGKGYRGNLVLINLGGKIGIVNKLKLEDYVKGVITREMPVGSESENLEALKAFSICVRTYALKRIEDGKTFYDLFDDTRDQVYGGVDAEHPLSNKAVEETEDKILTYNGKLASLYYHSTCGGHTEAAHNIFTEKEVPYMMGVKDGDSPYCEISPRFKWKEVYDHEYLIRRLYRSSLIKNERFSIDDIYIESRFGSGRVKSMVFDLIDDNGTRSVISISGNKIRNIIRTADNKRILWSTFFDVYYSRKNIEITGKGFGHGVGLCQWGAISLSRDGWSYDKILSHYYPGIKISFLYD